MDRLEIFRSATFDKWFRNLRDPEARRRVSARIDRLAYGNPGDVKPVGWGVNELRIDYGPGYRVYYMRRGFAVVVLLCGGDKRTQTRDIEQAIAMMADWRG